MQKLHLLRLAVCLLLILAAFAVATRSFLLLVVERAKSQTLVSLMPGHNWSDIQRHLSTRGRALSPAESASAAFLTERGTNTMDYWLNGGVMIRIRHDQQFVSEVEIRKVEFR